MAQNVLKLENNVNTIYNLISSIQKELSLAVEHSNQNMLKVLTQENNVLEKQVEAARKRLMELQGNAGLLSTLTGASDINQGQSGVCLPKIFSKKEKKLVKVVLNFSILL